MIIREDVWRRRGRHSAHCRTAGAGASGWLERLRPHWSNPLCWLCCWMLPGRRMVRKSLVAGLLAVLGLSPEHSLGSRGVWEEEEPPPERDFVLGKEGGRGSATLGARNWLFLRSGAAGLSLSAVREGEREVRRTERTRERQKEKDREKHRVRARWIP